MNNNFNTFFIISAWVCLMFGGILYFDDKTLISIPWFIAACFWLLYVIAVNVTKKDKK